jgi:hypothetical protein
LTGYELKGHPCLAGTGIAVLILLIIYAACLAFDINLFMLVTPAIVGCVVAIAALMSIAYCLLRWIRLQETLAAQKNADLRELQQEFDSLRQSVESMQKKLDHIESILENVE